MAQSVDPGVSLAFRLLKYWRLLAIAAAVVAADQASKAWISARLPFNTYGEGMGAITVVPRFFYIVHVGNTGAAWSLFSGRSILLAALAAATLVAIFIGRKALGLSAVHAQVCFGLMCGGIAGNLVDRLARGHVVDFLDFHFGSYVYPTFNVADSAICVGVALYVLSSMRPQRAALPRSP
jgi:signal peptidase II